MGQGRARMHMENGEGVFAFDQPAGGQDHRDEVCACILKKGQ